MTTTPTASATHRHFPTNRPLTPEQLAERLDYWQHKLCLDQWVIDLECERDKRMGNALGHCSYLISKHRATITMMEPSDNLEEYDPYDMEQVLVHELLHLHFAPWLDWSLEQAKMTDLTDAICFEQPIERLSWILIEIDRANALHKGNSHEMATMNAQLLDKQTKLQGELAELKTMLDAVTTPSPVGRASSPSSPSSPSAMPELSPARTRPCPACPPRPAVPGVPLRDREHLMTEPMRIVIDQVITERIRQIRDENYTPESDDHIDNGNLAHAAATYMLPDPVTYRAVPVLWPFKPELYKPKSRRQNLIRGIALALAEVERLDRAAARGEPAS